MHQIVVFREGGGKKGRRRGGGRGIGRRRGGGKGEHTEISIILCI